MKRIAILTLLGATSCASAQITYLTYSRTVRAIATETTDFPCNAILHEDSRGSTAPEPQTLRADAFGMNYSGPDKTPGTPSLGHADVTTRFEPNAIYVQATAYGQDGLCGCAGSGRGNGQINVTLTITTELASLWVLDSTNHRSGPVTNAQMFIMNTADPIGPPPLNTDYYSLNGRRTAFLGPGTYKIVADIDGGWFAVSGCGPGSADLDTRLSFGCPCAADFDRSGGTPDTNDLAQYVDLWLTGNTITDTDCSGGTPDTTDIASFFSQWLAGGC